ncbi:hypothetical protein VTL71DRAFT_9504 [Oculimacula yallundae]|uniref:Uncharacterized protein n=1 Tax=Oculimacula yallundae TaxID=86028 RepID=A0ABR4BUV1_9HELO
MLEKSESL